MAGRLDPLDASISDAVCRKSLLPPQRRRIQHALRVESPELASDGKLSADRTIRKFRIVAGEAARAVERLTLQEIAA